MEGEREGRGRGHGEEEEEGREVRRGRGRGLGRGKKGRSRAGDRNQPVPRPGQDQDQGRQQQQQQQQQQQPPMMQAAPPPAVAAWARGPPAAQQAQPQGAAAPPPMGAQAPGPAGAGAALMAGGRAARRGTSRAVDIRPGEEKAAAELQQGMQGLAIEEEGAVGGVGVAQEEGQQQQRPRRTRDEAIEDRYGDPRFRHEDLQNKQGESGERVMVRANFFKLAVPDNWKLCQYHVDFLPPCEGTKMRKALLYCHGDILGPVKAFDGMILFLPHRLDSDEVVVHSQRMSDNAQIKITIRFRCEVMDVTPSTLQVMNIILRKILAMMKLKQINRHYFDMHHRITVPKHDLEVIPGYQTSVLFYERDTLLDIDLTHKLLRTTSVLDLMYVLYNNGPRHEFQNRVIKEVIGMVVMTRYNNKTYTVDDIDWKGRVANTFDRNGNAVTYLNYYKGQYNIDIRDKDQPLLLSRAKKRDIRAGKSPVLKLIPELCQITGLTDANRSDFNLKKDLATHTRIGPDARAKRLTGFVNELTSKPDVAKELRDWQLGLDNQLVGVPARQLRPETLEMLDNHMKPVPLVFAQNEADWAKDMRGKKFKLSVSLERSKWLVVFIKQNRSNAEALVQTLRQVGPPMGMRVDDPSVLQLENDRNETYIKALRHGVEVPNTKMVVCILPNSRKDRYDAIKKFCCVDCPVPSQMVVDRTLQNQRRLMSVATKIAIQMNCKLGGVIWTTNIPMGKTMIVGLDTYHDSSKRGRSVGAVVASISIDHARYYSTCVFQMSHQELANQLQGCMTACMHAYHRENGAFPEKVVVFRDGVGDGQLNLVYRHEIPQIKDAIGDVKLTFVVVKKRTNARFFQEVGRRQGGGRGDRGGRQYGGAGGGSEYINPGPGTVIDDVVTKHNWFDFFLISQSVREGTVSPTHYNVLKNEVALRPEHMQRLAYKLCHMYYNWQGTIRVPAPCMYAHKMAFLVGQSLHTQPAAALATHLYYL